MCRSPAPVTAVLFKGSHTKFSIELRRTNPASVTSVSSRESLRRPLSVLDLKNPASQTHVAYKSRFQSSTSVSQIARRFGIDSEENFDSDLLERKINNS